MSARHRMTASPDRPQRGLTVRSARRKASGIGAACDVLFASMVCAACVMALVLNTAHAQRRTIEASQEPPALSQPVSQEGTVIAVTADSVTARSVNGYTQTYRVTPDTTLITHGAAQRALGAAHFTVNDRVDIVGTIEDGTALATTVADRGQGHGDGPPMDSFDGQVIPAGHS